MDSKVIKMLNTSVNISRTKYGTVFVQTNAVTYKGEFVKNISDCQLEMSEEDCIDLAITLSYVHLFTEYEDADYNITRFSDGEIKEKYQNNE